MLVHKIASFPDDSLSPEEVFLSQEDLSLALNIWAITKGYNLVIRRSTIDKSGRRTITYSCDRFRHSPNAPNKRQRNTTPRGTGCPFSVIAKETWADTWYLKHRNEARFSQYNHEPNLSINKPVTTGSPETPDLTTAGPVTTKPPETLNPNTNGSSVRKVPNTVSKTLPTCSECHIQGHRRSAKSCPFKEIS